MLINFNVVLKDFSGKEIMRSEAVDEEGEESFCSDCRRFIIPKKMKTYKLTLKRLCLDVLTNVVGEGEKDGQKKFDNFQLALKINSDEDKVKLETTQITALKTLIGKSPMCNSLIVGRAWELLEQESGD